jgi:phosphoglycolate phosphatase
MPKYKAVLFDLDGTLVESCLELMDALNDTMDKYDLDHVSKQETKSWIGHGTLHLLIMALSKVLNLPYEEVKKDKQTAFYYTYFRERYAKHVGNHSYLFDGAMDILKKLKEHNIKTAVMTNKETAFTKIILDKYNLNDVLDIVVCGDTLEVKKPNPKGIFYILDKLKITDKKDALFIGDSDTDIKTAQNAKIECWAVPYGYNSGEPIENSNPNKMIKTLKDIEIIL